MYRGTYARLPLCRSVITTVLDIVPNMRACGPAWVSWKFPAEQKIGELGPLIDSHSSPSANLTVILMRRTQADLATAFWETYAPVQWSEATGKAPLGEAPPRGSVVVSVSGGETVSLLPPRSAVAHVADADLASMRVALAVAGVTDMPAAILAMKFFRLKLVDGKLAGSRPAGSKCTKHRRRKNLLRNNSTEKRRRSDGQEVDVPVTTYAAALHYAVVFVHGEPMAFADLTRIKSAHDRQVRYGYHAQRFGIDCFFSADGVRYYAPAASLDAVVGILELEAVHSVLYAREPFSEER